MKRPSEVIQVGLNETDVFQTELGAPTPGPDQGLFFVFYENNLEKQKQKDFFQELE